jgi:hypothetical protein
MTSRISETVGFSFDWLKDEKLAQRDAELGQHCCLRDLSQLFVKRTINWCVVPQGVAR